MADGVGVMVGDGDGKPDPEHFKVHMRTVKAGEDSAMRHDDFVGSYNNTGRVKLDKKKWTPSKNPEEGDNAFRADDWMGSGKTLKKTWKVKSASNAVRADETSKPGDFISPNSESSGRKWKPPPKDQGALPPWMGSPSGSSSPSKRSSTASSWKLRSPPPPVNATKHPAEESLEHGGEVTLGESQHSQHSHHSHVKGAIERLSNSFSHHNVTSSTMSPRHSPRHGSSATHVDVSMHGDEDDHEAVDHPKSGYPADYHSEVGDDSEEFEIASADGDGDDKEPAYAKPSEESTAAPAAAIPATGYVAEDDNCGPNPEEYKIQMRTVHAGLDSAMRHDDFVGSYNHTGRVKLEKKKWTPAKKPEVGDNAFRADDWMGSGKVQRKSWMPKSSKSADVPKPEYSRSKSENTHQWASPTKNEEVMPVEPESAEPVAESPKETEPELQPESDPIVEEKPEISFVEPKAAVAAPEAEEVEKEEVKGSEPSRAPSPPATTAPAAPAAGYVVDDDYERPNPEEYKIQMRTAHASEDSAMRHDDFVGSYNNTGRVKLEKKKWTPSKTPEAGDNAFRVDDWMGSGSKKTKSWKVKK